MEKERLEREQAEQESSPKEETEQKPIESIDNDLPKLIPCPDCGKEISRKAISCPACGCPLDNSPNIEKQEIKASSPFAIACVCAGVISIFTPVILTYIIVVASLILGVFSLIKKEKRKLLAVIGILLSVSTFFYANHQMDEARSKFQEAELELKRLERELQRLQRR